MSRAISLVTSDSTAHVAPGERLELWLTAMAAAKGGGESRRYRVDVVGLQGRWYDVTPREVDLGAGDEKRIGLSIHPPAGAGLLSGRYPFRVRLMAEDGHVAASAPIALDVGTRQALDLGVEPAEAVGSAATFTITLSNAMGWPATVLLDARVDAEGLLLRISPDGPFIVPAGGQCQATIAVTPTPKAESVAARPYTIEVRGALPGHLGDASAELTRRVQFTPRRGRPARPAPPVRVRRAPRLPALALPRISVLRGRQEMGERPASARRGFPLGIAAAALLVLVGVAVGMRQVGGAFVADRKPAASPTSTRSTRTATRGVPVVVARRTRVARPVGQAPPRPTATALPSRTATPLPSSTATPLPSHTATAVPSASAAAALPGVAHSPLLVARNQVSFGAHRVYSTSKSETINLVNVGQSPLVVDDVAVTGGDRRDFSLSGTCRHARIVPYDGCALRISFRALARGARQASISIRDHAGQQLGVIAVSGRGI